MFDNIEELEKEIDLFHKNVSDSNKLICTLKDVTSAIREMNCAHNDSLEKIETNLQVIPEKILNENLEQQSELMAKIDKINSEMRLEAKRDYTACLEKISIYNKKAENFLTDLSAFVNQLSELKGNLLDEYHKESDSLKEKLAEQTGTFVSLLDKSISQLVQLHHDTIKAISDEKSSLNDVSEQLKAAIAEIATQEKLVANTFSKENEKRFSKIESELKANSSAISELNKNSESILNDVKKGNKATKRNFAIIVVFLICILLIVSFLLIVSIFPKDKNVAYTSADMSQVINGGIESVNVTADISIPLDYIGSLKNNIPDGNGTYEWDDKTSYTGNWLEGKVNGDGVFISNFCKLEGTFSNNKLISGTDTIFSENAEVTFNVSDGVVDYSNVTVLFDDSTTYSGEWNKGITGNGTINFSNGDTYSGTLQLGKFSGSGTYIWKDGASYNGQWLDNMMDGEGIYYYTSDKLRYIDGNFKSNHPTGQLKYLYKDHEYTTVWDNGQCSEIIY